LAAFPAKVRREKEDVLLSAPWRKALSVHSNLTLAFRLEGAKQLSGAADKLMQLKGKYGPVFRGCDGLCVGEELLQGLFRDRLIYTGIFSETASRFAELEGAGPCRR
jgi:hypothetical protein